MNLDNQGQSMVNRAIINDINRIVKDLKMKLDMTPEQIDSSINTTESEINRLRDQLAKLQNLKEAARYTEMFKLLEGTTWDVECRRFPFTLNFVSKHTLEQRKQRSPLVGKVEDPFDNFVGYVIYPHGRIAVTEEFMLVCDDSHVYIMHDSECGVTIPDMKDLYNAEFAAFSKLIAFAKQHKMIVTNDDMANTIEEHEKKLVEWREVYDRMNKLIKD